MTETLSQEEFAISSAVRATHRILFVRGELDEMTAPELDEAINASSNGLPLIVDLSGLTFISSAGIHVLFDQQRRDRFAVVCPPGDNIVARVLAIVHAEETLALFDDHAGAEKALSNGRGG